MTQQNPRSPLHDASPDSALRLELVGQVSGVEACRIVSSSTHVVAGLAADCDLVLADPLVPRRAFRIAPESRPDPSKPDEPNWGSEA